MSTMKDAIIKKTPYLLLLVPTFLVYLPTLVYPVTEDVGSKVSFRPPGYVFAIVWPVVLFLLGISWFVRRKNGVYANVIYILLTLLLAVWIILYSINKVIGLIDIIICFLLTMYLYYFDDAHGREFNPYASITVVPLLTWLSFAMILNIYAL